MAGCVTTSPMTDVGWAAGAPERLGWVGCAKAAPYFVEEGGEPWTPIGYNDSIAWIELAPLHARRNSDAVERHLLALRSHGVTCVRLMLECAQSRNRYFERPIGRFNPNMVRLWDDLFALCERTGIRILLTPFDTFWTWVNWDKHPYNAKNGGPLKSRRRMLLDPEFRAGVKARLTFAVTRWSGSGALFAWDLWNEIHPAHAEDAADVFDEFIHDLSKHVRTLERRLHGRSHLQTVSLFGPELTLKPHLRLAEPVFRHPDLDFATIHIYAHPSINHPRNTVDAAISMGRVVRECLTEIDPLRPFLDTEHGPIHTFKDKRKTLPAAFDDEMFSHMQWAHLASGGAGGGMRWPNRHPHVLTPGMRLAQKAMADFLPLIDWAALKRRNISSEVVTAPGRSKIAVFGCADASQGILYLLRRDTLLPEGRVDPDASPISPIIRVPGLGAGRLRVTAWDTRAGVPVGAFEASTRGGVLTFSPPGFVSDLALAFRAADPL